MNTFKQYSRLMLGALLVLLSLMLIFVVGYAQALKSYQQQSRDAILAQTEAARIGIEQVLNSGVPLPDIAGLEKVLAPIADADSSVVDIRVISGQQELYRYTDESMLGSLVSIPLNNKFTQVGALEVMLSDHEIAKTIDGHFKPMLGLVLFLTAAFVFFVLRSANPKIYFTAFGGVFLAMSTSVFLMVGALYKSGLENKADSMANIVTQRLAPVLSAGIGYEQVSGIDRMLDSFRQSNPEVSSISVSQGNTMIAKSQARADSMAVESMAAFLVEDTKGSQVTVAFDPKALLAQLLKTLKNFAILFAGCAFICFAFVRLLCHSKAQSDNEAVLAKVKPLLLVTVLMESLMAPVLPQYLTQIAVESGASESWSSYFFTLYFVGFAATLLPVARLLEVWDIRKVLGSGIVLSSLGCLLLAYDSQLMTVLVARLISGVGQATIFIAVQGYILRCSDQSNKTQAAGIIVFCFNAGFISGAAIGALLADTVGVQGIFMLAVFVGGLMYLFALTLPSMAMQATKQGTLKENFTAMVKDASALMRVPSFMRTMLLVGIPTKMMLTGVVFFAVPILLSNAGVERESIGQVLMAYAFSVLFVSGKVSPMIDRVGSAKWALCLGSGVGAVSLILLSFSFRFEDITYLVLLATFAMLVMGISHGLINAPVVTHVVTSTQGANANSVASTYRFLERLGHVLGSIVVGALLTHLGHTWAFFTLSIFFGFAGATMWLLDRTPSMEGQS
ncbi:MFS transporter [Vibrio europaeus]|uniref:MFS transporter n=1 Tax=Vibrio tubiashii TaxID=29498 RepID=A0AAE5GQF9_9VIBR|nr:MULTISPECIES: MFS transporter [Vibrio]KLN65986.1 major facilitator transporter [Vibrio sp. VPAP30]MCG9752100.1 MFS transporter [Vibrio brasiliensis]MDC5721852.1 MFS transporter [Vibrio europaeus]MDC5758239.1 MFS transporter [Vibrio europaeus]MDC5776516.1 MFS transporter [Vibrio europaeus]